MKYQYAGYVSRNGHEYLILAINGLQSNLCLQLTATLKGRWKAVESEKKWKLFKYGNKAYAPGQSLLRNFAYFDMSVFRPQK